MLAWMLGLATLTLGDVLPQWQCSSGGAFDKVDCLGNYAFGFPYLRAAVGM